jgi:hypothetical protein
MIWNQNNALNLPAWINAKHLSIIYRVSHSSGKLWFEKKSGGKMFWKKMVDYDKEQNLRFRYVWPISFVAFFSLNYCVLTLGHPVCACLAVSPMHKLQSQDPPTSFDVHEKQQMLNDWSIQQQQQQHHAGNLLRL